MAHVNKQHYKDSSIREQSKLLKEANYPSRCPSGVLLTLIRTGNRDELRRVN
jgi:hypothetical protein